jgi:hypothetical protein
MPLSLRGIVTSNQTEAKMLRYGVIVAAACAALCGCSSMNLQGDLPADEPIYTTGSHLPTRSGGASSQSVKEMAPPTIDQTMKGQVCTGGPCGGIH